MNKKKWYHCFWKSAYQWIGGLFFLIFVDFRYDKWVAVVWFIIAGVNLYRGLRYYKVDR